MTKQIVSREEQETLINIDYEAKQLIIYTNRYTVAKRILAKGYEPYKKFKDENGVYAVEFRFSTKDIGKFLRTGIFGFGGN